MRKSLRIKIAWAVLALAVVAPFSALADMSDEQRIGRKEHEKLSLYTHFYEDAALNEYVNSVGQRLAANSDYPDLEYHFFIVDSPDINAFALPGGYIYINRGLMTYLTSEAQLAAVLSHEIAHVTKRHGTRQRDQRILGNVAAWVATIALWNASIGDAIRLENTARVSGYGREMELEADEYGATYLYRTGYDPQAIIEVLSILKDHQTFTLRKGREQGRAPATYHGVFSTHPRNDQRLADVIQQAGLLPPGEALEGRTEYRKMMDGVVFGDNDKSTSPPGYERYSSKSLGVTMLYPESWTKTTQGQEILLDSGDGTQLQLTVAVPEDSAISAKDQLLQKYQLESLEDVELVYEEKGTEHDAILAIATTDPGKLRVAAIKVGAYTYFFENITPIPLDKETDVIVKNIIKSFRRAESEDYPPDNIYNVYYHRLAPGETFAELAQSQNLGRYTEDYLRLMNGYYPKGEAQPGTWIKMAK